MTENGILTGSDVLNQGSGYESLTFSMISMKWGSMGAMNSFPRDWATKLMHSVAWYRKLMPSLSVNWQSGTNHSHLRVRD